MDEIKINILGKWKAFVSTPFGVSDVQVSITSIETYVSGNVVGEKGSFDFTNGKILNDKLTFSVDVETPIKATIYVDVTFNTKESFLGKVTIDRYATMDVEGKKNVNL
jgi:hypothetical protein